MNVLKLSMFVCVGGWLVGCTPPVVEHREASSVNAWDGLTVVLETPKREFTPGERFTATVVARNDGEKPVMINARTGALGYVRLMNLTQIGWEQVRRYPETSMLLIQNWTLQPKEERRIPLDLVVEPDWPTGVPLRLVGSLNGRPEVAPAVTIIVREGAGGRRR